MLEPDYYLIEFHLYPDAPSELIWDQAQAQGAYIKFNPIGDVVIIIDSRHSYSTQFALQWGEWVGIVRRDGYYAEGPEYHSRRLGKLSA
jgi:hypothetical protein